MPKNVFALDFGRGNMSAFYGEIDVESPSPKRLTADGGEPSGFAKLDNGTIVLGTDLISNDVHRVKSYHINFKAIPNEQNRSLLIEYARAWRERLKNQNPAAFSGGEDCWFIGIPTGWRKKQIVEDYRQIFKEAGYPNPIIVPESNAAMYYVQRTYGAVARANPEMGVLCLDMGAYSDDTTHIMPGKVSSYGGFVGAALIEQMMLILNLQGKHVLSKRGHISPELLEVVHRKYHNDEKYRCFLLLQMRHLKEMYYTSIAQGRNYARMDIVTSVELDEEDADFKEFVENGENFFELYLNDKLADMAIDSPIRDILGEEFSTLPPETQEEIRQNSWKACLLNYLDKSLELCPKLAEAGKENGSEKPVVILTGGPARMPFVESMIIQKIPNIDLYKDATPMDTIAKGLWYFAPDKLRAMEFDDAFTSVLEEKDADGNSALNGILSEAHDKLGVDIIVQLAVQPANCIVSAVKDWNSYNCTSKQIIPRARAVFKEYFKTTLPTMLLSTSKDCKQFIAEKVNESFRKTLETNGSGEDLFQPDKLDIPYIDTFIRDELLGEKIFNILDDMIEGHNELYEKFPNPGRLNLFSRRTDMLAGVAEQLDKINDNWRNEVLTALKEIYDSREVYGPFAEQCGIELCKALERKKKTILGDLIVEDITDEENAADEE